MKSVADKYPTKGSLGAATNHTYNQYQKPSENAQLSLQSDNSTRSKDGKNSNLKVYSGRSSMTRVPSQIINPAAVHMRDSSG